MHGLKIFLPAQYDGQGRIYHDKDINNTIGICGQIKFQGKIKQWIHLWTGN